MSTKNVVEILTTALRLAADFIENVSEDDPKRTEKFFAVREAWRTAFAEVQAAGPDQVTDRQLAAMLIDMLHRLTNYEREAFENDEEVNGADLVEWFSQFRRDVLEVIQAPHAQMGDEEFNALLNGPLHHPLVPLAITRLVGALRCVCATTPLAAEALREYCKDREARDKQH